VKAQVDVDYRTGLDVYLGAKDGLQPLSLSAVACIPFGINYPHPPISP